MKPSKFLPISLRLGLILGLLWGGKGLAQTTEITRSPEVVPVAQIVPVTINCPDLPEVLVNVRVGDSNRGDQMVRLSGDQLLIPLEVLEPEEAGYIAQTLDCAGDSYIRLKPEVKWEYSASTLRVILTPTPKLLGQNSYDLSQGTLRPSSLLPLFAVQYQLAGRTSAQDTNGNAQLGAQIKLEKGYIKGLLSSDYQSTTFQGSKTSTAINYGVEAGYRFAANVRLTGFWQGNAALPSAGGSSFDFSGLRLELQSDTVSRWPRLEFDLPLSGDLEIYDNGFLIQGLKAKAGKVVLENIPLIYNKGRLSVRLAGREATAELITQDYDLTDKGSQGSWSGMLESGVLAGALYTGGKVQWLPSQSGGPQVQASGYWRENKGAAADLSVSANAGISSFGVSLNAVLDAKGTARGSGSVSYGVTLGNWGVGVSASVPFDQLQRYRFNFNSNYARDDVNVATQIGFDNATQQWSESISALVKVLPQLSMQSFASASGENNLRLGVKAVWTPTPEDRVSGEASRRPSLAWSHRFDESNSTLVSTDFQSVQAEYQHQSVVDAYVLANTTGFAYGSLKGELNLVQGKFSLTPLNAGSILILHTGVAGMRIYFSGQLQGRTDAQGDLTITGVSSNIPQVMRLEINDLPLEVNIKSKDFSVRVVDEGVYEMDIRDNFTQSQFIGFKWNDKEVAKDAELVVGKRRYDLDSQGFAFVEDIKPNTVAKLILGERTCQVTLNPQVEEVTCAP